MKLDVCALVLIAIAVFLGIALWTYHPTDPPSTLVWPQSQTVKNSCGRAGALTAFYLFESLGIGAYYLPDRWQSSRSCCWFAVKSINRCCGRSAGRHP